METPSYEPFGMDQDTLNNMSFPNPARHYGSSIIKLTNPQPELDKLQLTLRSERINDKNEPVSVGEPLLNEEGVNSVTGQVQAIVNQVTILSNLDKGTIPRLMDFLGDTLARDLMLGRERYEIQSGAARDKIYFAALTTAYITMKRALEEGDRRFWKGSVQEIHSKVENPKSRGSILSYMWGGRN